MAEPIDDRFKEALSDLATRCKPQRHSPRLSGSRNRVVHVFTKGDRRR
jgi:hypothetical protein